jgi:hypothetical protein
MWKILINKLSLHLNLFEDTICEIVYFEYEQEKYLKLLYLLVWEAHIFKINRNIFSQNIFKENALNYRYFWIKWK